MLMFPPHTLTVAVMLGVVAGVAAPVETKTQRLHPLLFQNPVVCVHDTLPLLPPTRAGGGSRLASSVCAHVGCSVGWRDEGVGSGCSGWCGLTDLLAA